VDFQLLPPASFPYIRAVPVRWSAPQRHARQLDAAERRIILTSDPAARPIFLRLTQEFPRVRGQVFGAFRECSADVARSTTP
jgi:hypothetical protein